MPRKSRKAQKPPLMFLEQSLDGARLQNVPEVRSATNPKSFVTERPLSDNTVLNYWVSSQFDQSHLAPPPVRRGRRKCLSTTNVLDRYSQLSMKNGVCKFPSLTFERGSAEQPNQTRERKSTTASTSTNLQQLHRTASLLTSHCQPTRMKRSTGTPKGDASPRVGLEQQEAPSDHVSGRGSPFAEVEPPSFISTPPDVEVLPQGGSAGPSPHFSALMGSLSQPPSQPPDTLVADTPERDYGLRVTWRRRKGLMMLLEKGGHLSKVDALIPS